MKIGIIPILTIGIITLSSLLPGNSLPDDSFGWIPHFDKVVHVILYFAGVLSITLFSKIKQAGLKKIIFIACLLFAYSISLEFIQEYMVPGRSFELLDIIANFIGTLIGYLTTLIIVKKVNYGN